MVLLSSSSQVFANDLYRRGWASRWHAHRSEEEVEQTALKISRIATFAVLVVSFLVAWMTQGENVIFTIWLGLGGLMAAIGGPLIVGVVWRGVTKKAALVSFVMGAVAFWVLYAGIPAQSGVLGWLGAQKGNPFACAALAEIVGVFVVLVVSKVTQPLPQEHLCKVFDDDLNADPDVVETEDFLASKLIKKSSM